MTTISKAPPNAEAPSITITNAPHNEGSSDESSLSSTPNANGEGSMFKSQSFEGDQILESVDKEKHASVDASDISPAISQDSNLRELRRKTIGSDFGIQRVLSPRTQQRHESFLKDNNLPSKQTKADKEPEKGLAKKNSDTDIHALGKKSKTSFMSRLGFGKKTPEKSKKKGGLTWQSLKNLFGGSTAKKMTLNDDVVSSEPEQPLGGMRLMVPMFQSHIDVMNVTFTQNPSPKPTTDQKAATSVTTTDKTCAVSNLPQQEPEAVINEYKLKSNIVFRETATTIVLESPRFALRYTKTQPNHKPPVSAAPCIQGDVNNLFLTPRTLKARQQQQSRKNTNFKDNVRLFVAVQNGRVQEVQEILAADEEQERKTSLHLIDINFHYSVESKQTPLHIAARDNNAVLVELLIASGADVNSLDYFLRSPLHCASTAGAHETIVLLLSHGAKVNIRDSYGNSPFYLCVKGHYFDIAQDFILFGADINFKRQNGITSLHECMRRGDVKAIEFFLSLHADGQHILFNARDEDGDTPLFKAIAHNKIQAISELLKHYKQVKLNLSLENTKGQNAFHIAAMRGRTSLTDFLIKAFVPLLGKDLVQQMINLKDKTLGCTPLHLAVKHDHVELVRYFVKMSNDVYNAQPKNNILQNLFAQSPAKKDETAASALVDLDVNVGDRHGNTAFMIALRRLVKEPEHKSKIVKIIKAILSCKRLNKSIKNTEGDTAKSLCGKLGIKLKALQSSKEETEENSLHDADDPASDDDACIKTASSKVPAAH